MGSLTEHDNYPGREVANSASKFERWQDMEPLAIAESIDSIIGEFRQPDGY